MEIEEGTTWKETRGKRGKTMEAQKWNERV
jgi:hypothetical protein